MYEIYPVSIISVCVWMAEGTRDTPQHDFRHVRSSLPAIQPQLEIHLILMLCLGRVPWFRRFRRNSGVFTLHPPLVPQRAGGFKRLGIEELIETRREHVKVVQPRPIGRLLKYFP